VAHPFLTTLLERLGGALGAAELDAATRPPDGAGARRSFGTAHLRIDGRLLAHPLPRVTLQVDPPADARALCEAWAIDRPVAVSPDVHQRTWQLLVAGEVLPDPYAPRRIAAHSITAGRWEVAAYLSARPSGELPGVVSGASPAYDVRERGGTVRSIEISPIAYSTRIVAPSADAPTADRGATVVAMHDAAGPVAGAALADAGGGVALASQLWVDGDPRDGSLGAALLDTLEALARDRGSDRLRLHASVFLLGDAVPYERCGYGIGPEYAGDPDAEIWAEKDLRPLPGQDSPARS
jgi:GNAT superfamily N-acetyltransferase